jgi:hypothetical protein
VSKVFVAWVSDIIGAMNQLMLNGSDVDSSDGYKGKIHTCLGETKEPKRKGLFPPPIVHTDYLNNYRPAIC